MDLMTVGHFHTPDLSSMPLTAKGVTRLLDSGEEEVCVTTGFIKPAHPRRLRLMICGQPKILVALLMPGTELRVKLRHKAGCKRQTRYPASSSRRTRRADSRPFVNSQFRNFARYQHQIPWPYCFKSGNADECSSREVEAQPR